MHLRFAYLTSRVELKHNSLFCDEFEQATDILNSYVREGYTLLSAYLVDEGQQIRLPIHAFDGELVGESVHHLQEEWQQILYL